MLSAAASAIITAAITGETLVFRARLTDPLSEYSTGYYAVPRPWEKNGKVEVCRSLQGT